MYPPEGFDVSQLLQNAQRMQQQFAEAQQDLAETEVVGSASGGLVRATVTGAGELVALDIDRSVVDPDDVETLADLVIAAVRDANAEVQRLASEQLGAINEGLAGFGGAAGEAEQGEEMSISDRIAGLLGGRPDDSSESGPDRPAAPGA